MPILKAIRDAISRKGYWGLISTGLPETKYKWDQTDFLRANEISLYVNRAIEKRSEKVGQIQFILKRGDEEITQDPRLDILYKPNKLFTGAEFWALYQKYKDLTGEAYILMLRGGELFGPKNTVSELHLLRPDLVQHVYNKETGEIEKFIFGPNRIEYQPEDIIYSFRPDPLNPIRGSSLLKAGVRAIETERQITEYQVNVLKNGGKVESVFKFKANLTKTQLEELKKGYKDEHTGTKVGSPLFIGGDVDYQRMGLDPAELGYLETKGVTLNDILILTGVPKSVLASVDDVKFDNADASWKIFLRETIKPLLTDLTTKLDLTLFGDSKDLDLTFVDPTPEDTKAIIEKVKAGHEVNALTINEKREALGFDPIPDGDVILVPFSVSPLDSVLNPPDPQPQQDPQADPTKPKAARGIHPLKDQYIREKYGEVYIKKADRREQQFLKLVKHYFQAQEKRITEKLQVTRTFRKKGLMDELFDSQHEIKLGVEEFLPFLTEVLRESGSDAMKLMGSTPIFVLPDHVASWMEKRAQFFVKSINETTFDKLKSEFSHSLETGEGRDQLVKRIQEAYGNISKSRAATIARTEIQSASQKGAFEGYKQAGLRTKIWVATLDHRTRHAHAAADGQEVPLDMPFNVGGESLMFPGDPNGSAENTINCRCSV